MQDYKAFCELNNVNTDEQGLLDCAQLINEIAAQLPTPIQARPEQAVTMCALLNSPHERTFTQLPTGTGKSLMFGLMARYLNFTQGVKVAVIVPNEELAAIQQDKYCHWACRISDNLPNKDAKEVFYCTYNDFLTGDIPLDTVLLIDEIDSLFFSDNPEVRGTKFLSAILLLSKYKVIGMTATFRGDQGKNKILQFIKESHVIKTTDFVLERTLQLDVFGKLKAN
jgi:superfamily II DNA or RNA helicase